MTKPKILTVIKPSFWVFLLIAALLWYGDKLGERYTTEITIPVEVKNDFSSRLWIEQPKGEILCRAEGMGGRLMAYKLKMGEPAVIAMSQLSLRQVPGSDRYFRVDKNSLTGAMASTLKDLRIHDILDTALIIEVSPVESKRLPVRSRIEVGTARQYMLVEGVKFDPDSVNVRGPKVILDTLDAIYTRPRQYEHIKTTVVGQIGLEQREGVLLSDQQVDFRAEVLPFTQHTLELPVRVENMPQGVQAVIVPSHVTVVVNVPLRDYERIREERLHACIDYRTTQLTHSGRYVVRIDSLPPGTEVMRIEPQFVEPFFVRH